MIANSRDVRTDGGIHPNYNSQQKQQIFANNGSNSHNQFRNPNQRAEEFLRIPNNPSNNNNSNTNKSNSNHYNQDIDKDKTFYNTLDTEEELDPEIAADLKKMFVEI